MTEFRPAWVKTVKYRKPCWHLSVSNGRDDYPVAVVLANRHHYEWTVWNRDRLSIAKSSPPRDRKARARSLERAIDEATAALLRLLTAHERAALMKRAASRCGDQASQAKTTPIGEVRLGRGRAEEGRQPDRASGRQ